MSTPTRCLLDKVVARRMVEGLLRVSEGDQLSIQELFAVDLLYRSTQRQIQLFITPASKHVLDLLQGMPRYSAVIRVFLSRTAETFPTRYFTRWSRRLREFGFTREDARVLALASFGSGEARDILGMHWVATYDQPMINLWTLEHAAIEKRLKAMCDQLPSPYSQVRLPRVTKPELILPE